MEEEEESKDEGRLYSGEREEEEEECKEECRDDCRDDCRGECRDEYRDVFQVHSAEGTPRHSPSGLSDIYYPTKACFHHELLHIVDSAIMGNPESLERLKKMVRGAEKFGDGVNSGTVAFMIVESLFVTMGGVEVCRGNEDTNPPSVMLNSRAAIVSGELIPSLPCVGDDRQNMSPRTHMVKGLLGIVHASARNRAMCSTAGLLTVLLRAAEKVFVQDNASAEKEEWNGIPLCYCIQLLAGHSLSVSDLNRWLEVITKTLTTPWAKCLMHSLEKAMREKEGRGPACTFEFDGESSGLLSPAEKTWPFNNGYAFATWIYIETFADNLNTATTLADKDDTTVKSAPKIAAETANAFVGEDTTRMPRLFSFVSADNHHIEAYFHAQFLVVEYSTGRGKKAYLHFSHAFKPQHWYFIGLEHNGKQGILAKSETELKLYIDGSLSESLPFDFLTISKPLSFCCIGTNPPPITINSQHRHRQGSLFAELGPIYIFHEPIGSQRMARLASRGGDFLPSISGVVESPRLTKDEHVKGIAEDSVLLDTEIARCLHLLYHPYLLMGRYCPDASPMSAPGLHPKLAEVVGQVHVARRMHPQETLWAIADGGPMSLLPLVVNDVYDNSLEPKQGDIRLSLATSTLAAPIFRIISMASQYHVNKEELLRRRGPEVLSRILSYLLQSLSSINTTKHDVARDEELVAAVVSLCQYQKYNDELKVQLFSSLLLDLKMWSPCSYGLQKKVLSSLADLVFTEALVMREANAIQMLLDGCRKCYWTIREEVSIDTFVMNKGIRPVGEVNALVEELLVIVELLILAAPPSLAKDDICYLLGFMVDCPQPNQVARTLQLLHRLVVQPNTSRSHTFAEAFISGGGVETLLVLLQREAKTGDCEEPDPSLKDDEFSSTNVENEDNNVMNSEIGPMDELCDSVRNSNALNLDINNGGISRMSMTLDRMSSVSDFAFAKNLGGITLSISAENARNNVYNADRKDGIVLGIINLLSALISSGHLQFGQHDVKDKTFEMIDGRGSMFDDKLCLALFSLQKAFQAAPNRLLTKSVYTALLSASVNESTTDGDLNFYDCGHRFEELHLLLVLLRSLPYASAALQMKALQDLLVMSCSHPDNRSSLTKMDEWPEWILEILIYNYETGGSEKTDSTGLKEVEDLIHNFIIIILEHSMYRKDGWQDFEAIIHCVEWLSMVGGSSTGKQRVRREESLPIFKRRLLGGLLDFAAKELHAQTQVIALAAAGAVAGGLPPKDAKAEVENAAELSVSLVENAIVLLMLVEDHLRLQSKLHCASAFPVGTISPLSKAFPSSIHSSSTIKKGTLETVVDHEPSSSSDTRPPPLDISSSMVDGTGQLSPSEVDKLAAASAAEPYDSVNCAFVSYGSCTKDLAEGWKYRSRLWYGVGLSSNTTECGGGGGGREAWKTSIEKDSDGNWIELPLLKKCLTMLQVLLLDKSVLGGGHCTGGGSGSGVGSMNTLYQLLDSDQPFLSMLRLVLVSLREEDDSTENNPIKDAKCDDGSSEDLRSKLLWSVLSPVLNMPTAESKRQRVFVTSCILYSEVFHAVGIDRKPLRTKYLETILPPFVSILRKWRPLLADIPQLATSDGCNPLTVDSQALSTPDALPIEAALTMISPGWAAVFASPPAAMALAMIAAGAGGGETPVPASTNHLRRDSSMFERKPAKLQNFSSFQKPLEATNKVPVAPKDKARAKAEALAAARDLERNAKIGSGRGLSAVAMATSSQRRNLSDSGRIDRWNLFDAMGTAWLECLQSVESKSVYGKGFNALSIKFIAILVGSLALARNMQRSEVDRRTQVDLIARHHLYNGLHEWRKLVHCLIETSRLFSPFRDRFYERRHVFWKLDSAESSERMRRCFRRNYHDMAHLGANENYKDPAGQKQGNYNVVCSLEVLKLAAEALPMDVVNDEDVHENNDSLKSPLNDIKQGKEDHIMALKVSEQPLQMSTESNTPRLTEDEDLVKNLSVPAPGYVCSENELIILELPTSIVRPSKILRGTLQITSRRINFIIDNSDNNVSGDGTDTKERNRVVERDKIWSISCLHQIYSRRYLLRRSALELFMVDRSNFFFDFDTTEGRENAYRALLQARPPNLSNIYLETQEPEEIFQRTELMERWAKREITNFEYLMQLNTLAGRSYSDITQYPIFPWILADYKSSKLDLSNPSSYRDLSKPIGALNPGRLKEFRERYSSFNDPVIPKFHYSSHYSNPRTVLYYLGRIEPFLNLSMKSQGGENDIANSLLSDVGAAWDKVLKDMDDVKELVPELFYLPETLTNESLANIDSVRLPPWAHDSIDFVQTHRMALESEHVSAHLHEWIDLIFGYKQQGKEAISADNVFPYFTYEQSIDIDKVFDEAQQKAIRDQITYFGQTPSQLLTIPHMKRMAQADINRSQTIFCDPEEVQPYTIPHPEKCSLPAAAISDSENSLVIVDVDAPTTHITHHKSPTSTKDDKRTSFLFQHALSSTGTDAWSFSQAYAFRASNIRSSAVVSITRDQEIITGGHVDNSIQLISVDGANTLEIAKGHRAPVSCLALSLDDCYLVTGSCDTTILLWRLHKASSPFSNSPLHPTSGLETPTSTSKATANTFSQKSRMRRIEGPKHVLRGHEGKVTSCCINSNIGVVASCSDSSDVLLHSIRKGRLLRRLSGIEASAICLSPDGMILVWNKLQNAISSFTINGVFIARSYLPLTSSISSMQASADGRSVLVGLNPSSDNVNPSDTIAHNRLEIALPSVCWFDLYTLKMSHSMKLEKSQEIMAMSLNDGNTNLLVSTADKQLIVFMDPNFT